MLIKQVRPVSAPGAASEQGLLAEVPGRWLITPLWGLEG